MWNKLSHPFVHTIPIPSTLLQPYTATFCLLFWFRPKPCEACTRVTHDILPSHRYHSLPRDENTFHRSHAFLEQDLIVTLYRASAFCVLGQGSNLLELDLVVINTSYRVLNSSTSRAVAHCQRRRSLSSSSAISMAHVRALSGYRSITC